jgi:hypothetical protein
MNYKKVFAISGKVEKILTWRWKEEEEDDKKKSKASEPVAGSSKSSPRSVPARVEREFFIKWKDQSYWHCSWIKEIQLDVFHPQTYRCWLQYIFFSLGV